MSDLEQNQDEEFSLADIAGLDASGIAEVRFENLPGGVYMFRGVSAELQDTTNRDEERRVVCKVVVEVAEVKSVIHKDFKSEEAKAELIGKKHTEKFYVVPAKAAEGLGLIRAFIGDIGLGNEGPFGGVQGCEPGILDQLEGHEFLGKIRAGMFNGNPTANLQVDKPKKKAA